MGTLGDDTDLELQQIEFAFKLLWESHHEPDISTFLAKLTHSDPEAALEVLLPIDIEFRTKTVEKLDCEFYAPLGERAVAIARDLIANKAHSTIHDDKFATQLGAQPTASSLNRSRVKKSESAPVELIADRYRLLKQIGQGGMGTVWLAQQERPIRRRVAVKVINNLLGGGEALSRFEAERQALAMMNHPNIAKVLDAGTTREGRPFFVMELVKGVPITRYCNDNRLTNRQRLELMVTVCDAVQHAHQKGIIHRDLKPSNILVAIQEDRHVPKVIDFGLAKALDSGARLSDQTVITEIGQIVGTLQYMSPEQAGSNELDIDTRTDIYSIGILLYQLLTDIIPLNQESLTGKHLIQIVELICESDIPRPSTVFAKDKELLNAASRLRNTEPSQLLRSLSGELDWIINKAVEKNRINRYQTANGVGMDITRYLNNEPISARPPSNTYLLKKLIRKHLGLAVSIAIAAVLLLASTTVSTYFAVEASRARDKSDAAKLVADNEKKKADRAARAASIAEEGAKKQLAVFINSFAGTNLLEGAKKDMTAIDVLQEAEKNLNLQLQDDPVGQASMLHEIGKAYRGRSRTDLAVNALTKAYELRRTHLGPTGAPTNHSLRELVKARMEKVKKEKSRDTAPQYLSDTLMMMEEACSALSKVLSEKDHEMMRAQSDLGTAYLFAYKELEKLKIYRKAYIEKSVSVLTNASQMQERQLGRRNEITLVTRTNMTNAILKQGDADRAIQLSKELLEDWSQLHRESSTEVGKRRCAIRRANVLNNYGEALQRKGLLKEAIEVYTEALVDKEDVYGIGHSIWFNTVRGLLRCMVESGQKQEAKQYFSELKEKIRDSENSFDKNAVNEELERISNTILNFNDVESGECP